MRRARLLFVSPPANTLRSVARKVQATLHTDAPPQLLSASGATSGRLMAEGLTVADAQRMFAPSTAGPGGARGAVLQVSIRL